MGTVCGKEPEEQLIGLLTIAIANMDYGKVWSDMEVAGRSVYGRQYKHVVGDLCENVTHGVSLHILRFEKTPYVKTTPQGFDGIYRDKTGRLVIMESKGTERPGPQALDGKTGQMVTRKWFIDAIKIMTYEKLSSHNPVNKALGEEIKERIDKQGLDGIRRMICHTDSNTFGVDIYEAHQEDGVTKWDRIMSYTRDEISEGVDWDAL